MVYSEIPFGRESFGDQSAGKQCRSIGWFLHDVPYSTERFLKNLSELFVE